MSAKGVPGGRSEEGPAWHALRRADAPVPAQPAGALPTQLAPFSLTASSERSRKEPATLAAEVPPPKGPRGSGEARGSTLHRARYSLVGADAYPQVRSTNQTCCDQHGQQPDTSCAELFDACFVKSREYGARAAVEERRGMYFAGGPQPPVTPSPCRGPLYANRVLYLLTILEDYVASESRCKVESRHWLQSTLKDSVTTKANQSEMQRQATRPRSPCLIDQWMPPAVDLEHRTIVPRAEAAPSGTG